ncbi:hypothetical protein N7452_001907 [Penicillium brevicompactum]|uniref:Uncharacterized protein n=1 Tax=Penicillium brevicompactum TaxID=5074 RepID=A0A9W9R8T1_PENBR|nr:hypothetical protein N7452_001907 [Penicillium brevicompactum]
MSDWQEEWAFIPFFETIITTSLLIGRLRFDIWPYDFISDGDTKPGRRPSERGRYSAQVGEKKASRNAPYKGVQVGQLLAMPDDLLAPMVYLNVLPATGYCDDLAAPWSPNRP